ncbi:YihY/virulence factor BrkB family protein [Actinomycetes bacterium M1A6_2h]
MNSARTTVSYIRGFSTRVRGRLFSTDLALLSAGLTFYSAIAVVPLLLLGFWACTLVMSADHVVALATEVSQLIPNGMGARPLVVDVAEAGADLGLLGALVCIFPATYYGEGFRRVLLRYTRVTETRIGYRGRIASIPVLLLSPLFLYILLEAGAWMWSATSSGSVPAVAFRVWFGLVVLWLVLALPIGWVYRVVAPVRPSWRSVTIGALTTSSMVAGFLQGFVLFLWIPYDLGRPFGGLTVVGAVIAAGFWLWLLHAVVLAGWAFTLQLSTTHVGDLDASDRDGRQRETG